MKYLSILLMMATCAVLSTDVNAKKGVQIQVNLTPQCDLAQCAKVRNDLKNMCGITVTKTQKNQVAVTNTCTTDQLNTLNKACPGCIVNIKVTS